MVLLNEKQTEAFILIEKGHNVIVLGQAGTGKSHLIREIQARLVRKGKIVSVVASTGIASTQFRHGKTVHAWAGMKDGYLEGPQLIDSVCQQKEVVTAITETDLLIVDEASMVSSKLFDKLEYVCRHIRDSITYFGGLQIVCVGDWFQLPPVPTKAINDPGKYCFQSETWKAVMKHKVVLTDVIRQTDCELVKAINELERGIASENIHCFMQGLSRPLSGEHKPTYLYADNLQVDIHNTDELNKLPGVFTVYRSTDTGKTEKLKNVLAKEYLFLKLNCPVILLRNIGRGLVNGLQGFVTKLDDNGPTVQFPLCSKKLKKTTFSVFNPQLKGYDAERLQYPISPAYALTIHKAQGLTIPHVVVNCKNIFKAGQLGVAVGRAVRKDGLQVLNYSPNCCKLHPDEVYHFADEPGNPSLEDVSCCQQIPFVNSISTDDSEAVTVFEDSDDSDYNDEFLDNIARIEAESCKEAGAAATVSHSTQSHTSPGFESHYTETEIMTILQSLVRQKVITPEQIKLNNSISYLKTVPKKVKLFFDEHHSKMLQFFKDCGCAKKVKDQTLFVQKCHSYMNSERYEKSCQEMFNPRVPHKLLCGNVATHIRKTVSKYRDEDSRKRTSWTANLSSTSIKEASIPISAHSKVRYVGGFAVAKVKFSYMKLVRTSLYSHCVLDTWSKMKIDILQSHIMPHDEITKTTAHPDSITEVCGKQNVTCGLTNISDDLFSFFLNLESKRIPLYCQENLRKYKSDLLQNIHDKMESDVNLLEQFCRMFSQKDWLSQSHEEPFRLTSYLNNLVQGSVILTEVYNDINVYKCCE